MSQAAGRLQAQVQQQQEELETAAEAVSGAQQQAMRADKLSMERKVSGTVWAVCFALPTRGSLGELACSA